MKILSFVSIPHSHGKTAGGKMAKIEPKKEFQFLIVTVRQSEKMRGRKMDEKTVSIPHSHGKTYEVMKAITNAFGVNRFNSS